MRRTAMRMITTLGSVLLMACLVDCGTAEDAEQVADQAASVESAVAGSDLTPDLTPDSVREYAELAVAIEQEPERAAEILQEKGISTEQFEKALYAIAESAELSALFQEAKEAAAE